MNCIQPGKPQQNAYVERYNRPIRLEWLELYIFGSRTEVQEIATEWLWTYNHERLDMGMAALHQLSNCKWPREFHR